MRPWAEIKTYPVVGGWHISPEGFCVRVGVNVQIGDDVQIGDMAQIGNNVQIGNGAQVGDWVQVGDGVRINTSLDYFESIKSDIFATGEVCQ